MANLSDTRPPAPPPSTATGLYKLPACFQTRTGGVLGAVPSAAV